MAGGGGTNHPPAEEDETQEIHNRRRIIAFGRQAPHILKMALHGFQHVLRWAEFTTVRSAPDGSDEDAFTQAVFNSPFSLIQRADGTWVITPTRLNVTIRMDTPNSWVVSGRQSAALLVHEQGHYNITAVGARDCHTDILAIVGNSADDVQSQVNSIVSSAQSLIASVNDIYDEDPNCGTDHGSDSSAQAQWNLKIRNAMNSPTTRLADLNVCSGTSP